MPVQLLWLPLLTDSKNFLCYIGRGVVLGLGAGWKAGTLHPTPLKHHVKQGLGNDLCSSTMVIMGWATSFGSSLPAAAIGTPVAAMPPDARYCHGSCSRLGSLLNIFASGRSARLCFNGNRVHAFALLSVFGIYSVGTRRLRELRWRVSCVIIVSMGEMVVSHIQSPVPNGNQQCYCAPSLPR